MTDTPRRVLILFLIIFMTVAALGAQTQRSQAVSQPGIAPNGSFAIYSFSNAASIAINDGAGTPYPSGIAVSGVAGTVTDVSVVLTNITHTFSDDVDILLVAPNGSVLTLVSDVGLNGAFSGTHTIQDGGAPYDTSQVLVNHGTGTYAPTNRPSSRCFGEIPDPDVFNAPAPAGPYNTNTTFAAAFGGLSGAAVNGTWSLYVMDDCGGDTGSIAGGWTLNITDNFVSTALSATASCNGDNLAVTISTGDGPFNITGTGTGLPQSGVAIGTTSLTGPGSWTGVTVTETTGDLESVVLGAYTCPTTVIVIAGIPVPHLGVVMIDSGHAQAAFQEPGGDAISGVVLPADFDGNGFDTYVVADIVYLGGEYWLGLFLGSANWGYVPLDNVTVLTDLPLPTPSDSSDSGDK